MEERAHHRMMLLNLGCGGRYHPDWVNVDFQSTGPGVRAWDLNKGVPFPDHAFDAVYHSHLLEHFPRRYAPSFCRECYRVLRPGGIIRVAVPDLEQIVRLYLGLLEKALEGDETAARQYEWIMIEMLDQMVRTRPGGEMLDYWKQNPMPAEDFVIDRFGSEVRGVLHALRRETHSTGAPRPERTADPEVPKPGEPGRSRPAGEVHQWMYDRYSLARLLREAGFEEPHACGAHESGIPDFHRYLLDSEADGSVRKPDSLFMEATKPAEPRPGGPMR